MSFRVGNIVIIGPEEPGICEFCGKTDQLRPYGPNDERICYECMMLDEETGKQKMLKYLFGDLLDSTQSDQEKQ